MLANVLASVLASVKGYFGMYEALWTVVVKEADGSRSPIASSVLFNRKKLRLIF